jgi:hypothetical protein
MGGCEPSVTWPELMAATSLAADTGMALPLETGLATCLVSVALGSRLGLDAGELNRTYHLSLLQHIGCTAGQRQLPHPARRDTRAVRSRWRGQELRLRSVVRGGVTVG